MTNIRLNQPDAMDFILLEKEIENNAYLSNEAAFLISRNQFIEGDSLSYLSKIDEMALSGDSRGDYWFMVASKAIRGKDFQTAVSSLEKVERTTLAKLGEVSYLQGYCLFYLENYEASIEYFKVSSSNEDFVLSSKYFLARAYSNRGDYQALIDLTSGGISEEYNLTNALLHQLVGEGHVKMGEITKAYDSFEKAIAMHPQPTTSMYYQAGVSAFKLGRADEAIVYLKKSGLGSDEYASLSAFHLGQIYLSKQLYNASLAGFEAATSSNEDKIKEEAIYQAARIAAVLKDYNRTLTYSFDYIKEFPGGRWIDELNGLIAETYLRTSNFDLAIEYLESLPRLSSKQKSVYQKITFQKAQVLISDINYDEANASLRKSLKYDEDKILKEEAYFLLGEIALAQKQYQNAINWYRSQSLVTPESWYGIGYSYYNLGKYQEAADAFANHLATSGENITDSRVRYADCLYAMKQYDEALENYELLTASEVSNYAYYQIGSIHAELNEDAVALDAFNKIEQSDGYFLRGVLRSANIYQNQGKFEKSNELYSKVLFETNNSDLRRQALLNRATNHRNMGNVEAAINDFKEIVNYHIQSREALNAILALQEIAGGGKEIKDLDRYISRFKTANPKEDSIESIDFNAAKSSYFNQDYIRTIEAFHGFLAEHPNSSFRIEAAYYLGDAYYRLGRLVESREVFQDIAEDVHSYTTRVLNRLGDIHYSLGDFDLAINAYDKLKSLNVNAKENYNARFGLLKCFLALGNYKSAVEMIDRIEQAEWQPVNMEDQLKLMKATSLYHLGEVNGSKQLFNELANGSNAIAAQSGYYLAKINYDQEQYDKALNQLFKLNKELGYYPEWTDKAFLLIADCYIAKDELFQAKATLQSIIDHSKSEETIRLASIKMGELESTVSRDTLKSKKE